MVGAGIVLFTKPWKEENEVRTRSVQSSGSVKGRVLALPGTGPLSPMASDRLSVSLSQRFGPFKDPSAFNVLRV